jgi:undecaprenyl pyrophosphate synthase
MFLQTEHCPLLGVSHYRLYTFHSENIKVSSTSIRSTITRTAKAVGNHLRKKSMSIKLWGQIMKIVNLYV